MKQLALAVFKSTYFVVPVTALFVIIFSIFICFVSIKDQFIYPNRADFAFEYYTDKANGGNSQILEHTESDSALQVDFLLKNGFQSPYVGLSIAPTNKKYIEAGKYNQISLCILGKNIDRVGISIYTPPLKYAETGNNDEALYHSYLNISNQKKIYHIPINQLQHPEWWKDIHHLSETAKDKPDLNSIIHINIGSAFSQNIDNVKTLKIYSIAFTRNNKSLFFLLGLILIVSVVLLFGIQFWIAQRKVKTSDIIVSYIPLDIKNGTSGIEKSLEYINSHYSNSELTIEHISKETAISARRITQIIHEKYNCNFKTYLNRIRINESKRLLTQTDLNIGEVAYKVGFNTQSHYNRVFKSEMGISPTEYRDTQLS